MVQILDFIDFTVHMCCCTVNMLYLDNLFVSVIKILIK
jgi:hypothetical protein